MKKGIVLLAVLLLSAVFASGCVNTDDPVIGIWNADDLTKASDDKLYERTYEFKSANLGMEYWYLEGENEPARQFEFIWLSDGSTYTLYFSADIDEDGESDKRTAVLADGILTEGDRTYSPASE